MTISPKFINRIAAPFAFSLLLPLVCQAADDAARLRNAVDAAIRPLMEKDGIPGMAVAVTVDGKPSFFNYGVASKEANTPVSEATLFELGSVSKTFATTLAAYAQQRGKLSLQDHPGKYLPELKGSPIDKASLLNLGTYTAGGLPLQVPEEVTNEGMLDYFKQWKPDAAPGTQRRYSNPSIGLLGYTAALALGKDFAEVMQTTIFPGLGLSNSYIHVPAGAMPNYAWGYDKAGKPVRVNPGVLDSETYGVKSTAADMIRYVQANIAPGRLEPLMRSAVEGTHVGYFKTSAMSQGMVQGLGWEQYSYPLTLERLLAGNSEAMIFEANPVKPLTPSKTPPGPTLFDKTGSTNGFGAYVAFVPAKKIGIVMLANKNYPIPDRVKAAHAILEQLVR